MIKKFNELFAVTEKDTLGTALVKGVTKGYIQGVVAAGIGLGVVAIGVIAISKDGDSEEVEEEITEDDNAEATGDEEVVKYL